MSNILTIAETAAWLKGRDDFLIITHRRPDGDTLGCAGALAQSLREQKKTAYVLHNPETTPRYAQFVEDFRAPDGYRPGHTITIDTASEDLFPMNGNGYIGAVSLCIDHHPSNTLYAEFSCIDCAAASCGETVYDLLMIMSGSVSSGCAGSFTPRYRPIPAAFLLQTQRLTRCASPRFSSKPAPPTGN